MYDTDIKKDGDCALYVPCSQVQLARVVVFVIVLVDVVCVMLVVLIALMDVVHAVDTVFVAIFCNWRCTLYSSFQTFREGTALFWVKKKLHTRFGRGNGASDFSQKAKGSLNSGEFPSRSIRFSNCLP